MTFSGVEYVFEFRGAAFSRPATRGGGVIGGKPTGMPPAAPKFLSLFPVQELRRRTGGSVRPLPPKFFSEFGVGTPRRGRRDTRVNLLTGNARGPFRSIVPAGTMWRGKQVATDAASPVQKRSVWLAARRPRPQMPRNHGVFVERLLQVLPLSYQGGKMLQFWKGKPQDPPAPPEPPVPQFSIDQERISRRAACLAAKLEVEHTQQLIRDFETRHFEASPVGGLAHRVTVGLVSNSEIDWQRQKLYQFLARKVEAHQQALQRHAEVAA
jgi:hypothetical protein